MILIVQTGTTNPQVAARYGDYDAWFQAALPHPSRVLRAFAGEALPQQLDGIDGVLLTGSPASLRDEAPWMAPLGAWGLAVAQRLPVLGVCFGHQLFGEALGGWVARNPAGPEWGTVQVELTAAGRDDPLFHGLPELIEVQQTHADALVRAPEGVVALASNANTLQAFAWGPRLRTVQFHPEAPPEALDALLRLRGHPRPCWASGHGHQILRNWVERYVLG